jgi:hypothetical protein
MTPELQAVSELTKLTGEVREVTVAGEVFKIKPFKIGQLGKVMNLVSTLTAFADEDGEIKLLDAFTKGSESVLSICTIATGKPREWFDDVDVDEGLGLVLAIYEVNRDFFAQRVQPILEKSVPSLAGRSPLTAPTK